MNGVISVTHPEVQDMLLPFLERADPSNCKVQMKYCNVELIRMLFNKIQ